MGQNHRRRRLQRKRVVLCPCLLRLRGGGHGHQAQRQHRNRRPGGPQPPRQPERGQDIHQQQRQRPGKEGPLQRLFAVHRQTFNRYAVRPDSRCKDCVRADCVQRNAAVRPGIKPGRKPGARAGTNAFSQDFARNAGNLARVHDGAIGVQHRLGHPDLPHEIACLGRRRAGGHRQPFQHLHEKTGQRQGGPFGIRRHMDQNHLPLPHRLAGDQRRAIGQRGNGPARQIGVGLGQHLRADGHIRRNRKTVEGRAFGEGGQRLRLAPAHGAAHGPSAFAQTHRHQGVFRIAADIACGKTRPGKTQQQAALFQPVQQPVGL